MANFNNTNEEMSMEDILSSIRKYVSEEDAKKSAPNSQTNYPEPAPEIFRSLSPENETVISLDESHIIDRQYHSPAEHFPDIRTVASSATPMTYEEKSDLAEEVVLTAPKKNNKSGPFDKLTDALKSYGKSKTQNESYNTNSPTIDQFLASIAAQQIGKWIDENLQKITEEIVMREIEKIKSEE